MAGWRDDMEIETMKEAKQKCESEIMAIVNMFIIQTGLRVDHVVLIPVHEFGKRQMIDNVELDVRV